MAPHFLASLQMEGGPEGLTGLMAYSGHTCGVGNGKAEWSRPETGRVSDPTAGRTGGDARAAARGLLVWPGSVLFISEGEGNA